MVSRKLDLAPSMACLALFRSGFPWLPYIRPIRPHLTLAATYDRIKTGLKNQTGRFLSRISAKDLDLAVL